MQTDLSLPSAIDAESMANQLAAKLKSAMVAHEKFQFFPTAPPEIDPEALLKAGYPPRAIRALDALHGPGKDKAYSLLPLMLRDGIAVLLGPTGRGKTVMATLIAKERVQKGKSAGKFTTAYALFARMKQCWGKNEDAEAALGTWKRAGFLVIDEAQTRGESAWENAVLDELINHRYAHELPTIIIGNFDLTTAQKSLGPRIMDRANECGGIVDCNWESYRQ